MASRRNLLTSLGCSFCGLIAGCIASPSDDQAGGGNEYGNSDFTRGDPQAEAKSSLNKVDIELPGEPHEIANGQLPIHEVQRIINSDTRGLEPGIGQGSKYVRTGKGRTSISFNPYHEGSGRASSYATGTYRTAWTAPETGEYQLKAAFNRWGQFKYNLPPEGELMTSFDVNVQMINYNLSTVVANQRFPQPLQSANRQASSEIGEFLISTAISALVGYSLGLGLVARVVLSQVIDELIEIDSTGNGWGQYDVVKTVERSNTLHNIGGPFSVSEGTTTIFEISPMIGWSYEFEDFQINPHFEGDFLMDGFYVKKLD